MTISNKILDELLSGVDRPDDLLGDTGLMKELKVRLMERMLGAEMTEHLGYELNAEPPSQQINRRNGTSRKTLKGNDGAVPIDIPRDWDSSLASQRVRRGSMVWMTRSSVCMRLDYQPVTSAPILRRCTGSACRPT